MLMDVALCYLNPYLECPLCHGYLIDATTLGECLHSFCRCCIVRYLQHWEGKVEEENQAPHKDRDTSGYKDDVSSRKVINQLSTKHPLYPQCPVCSTALHELKPTSQLRSDRTLQALVYKLVPQVFVREMELRRAFYADHPSEAAKLSPERRGEGSGFLYNQKEDFNYIDHESAINVKIPYKNGLSRLDLLSICSRQTPGISLTLKYFSINKSILESADNSQAKLSSYNDIYKIYANANENIGSDLYLLVEPLTTLSLIRRLVLYKYSILGGSLEPVFFFLRTDYTLSLDTTMQDLVVMSGYQRHSGPLHLCYAIVPRHKLPARSLVERREEFLRKQHESSYISVTENEIKPKRKRGRPRADASASSNNAMKKTEKIQKSSVSISTNSSDTIAAVLRSGAELKKLHTEDSLCEDSSDEDEQASLSSTKSFEFKRHIRTRSVSHCTSLLPVTSKSSILKTLSNKNFEESDTCDSDSSEMCHGSDDLPNSRTWVRSTRSSLIFTNP